MTQTLATQEPMGYCSSVDCDLKEIRDMAKRFKQRRGYGAVKAMAQGAGVSKATVNRLLREQSVEYDTYQKFRDFFANNQQSQVGPQNVLATRECPHCGENVPSMIDGKPLIFCGNCGKGLGLECPKCEHLNTEPKAMYCTMCGEPLTDEAIEAREGLEEMTETQKEKAGANAASQAYRALAAGRGG